MSTSTSDSLEIVSSSSTMQSSHCMTHDPLRMWSHGTQGQGEYLPLSTDQLPGHYNQSVAPGLDVTPRQCRLPTLGTMDDQASVSCPTITGSEQPPRGHPIHQLRAAPSRHTSIRISQPVIEAQATKQLVMSSAQSAVSFYLF